MSKKRKKRRKAQKTVQVRANMSVRLSSMSEADYETGDMLELLSSSPLPPLVHVPEKFVNRARLVQALAAKAAIDVSLNREPNPTLVMVVTHGGDMHIQFRARFPKDLHSFWMVASEEESSDMFDHWFLSLILDRDLRFVDRFIGWDDALEDVEVMQTMPAMIFIKNFMRIMYDSPRQGENANEDLAFVGSPQWMKVFEFINAEEDLRNTVESAHR